MEKYTGEELMQSGNYQEALNLFYDELFKGEPTAELYKKIAHCNKYLKDDENAVDYYKKSLEIAPDDVEVIFNLAESLKDLNELEEATEYYQNISRNPKFEASEIGKISAQKIKEIHSTLKNREGGQLLKEGNFEEALRAFAQAMELNPNDRRNYLNTSVVYLKQGNIEEAVRWMQKTIEIDPYYLRAYFNLGTIYYQTNRFKKAIAVFEKAIEISPDDPECNDIRKNLAAASAACENAANELIQYADGEIISIALDKISELAASVIDDDISSADMSIMTDGKYHFFAYGKNKTYKIISEDGNLLIE
jgi:tetratricopeptide (TPR) repeat protein